MQCIACSRDDLTAEQLQYGHGHTYPLAESAFLVVERPLNQYSEGELEMLADIAHSFGKRI